MSKIYELLQDYVHPFGKTHKGTVGDYDFWKYTFPELIPHDLDVKDDWFKLKEDKIEVIGLYPFEVVFGKGTPKHWSTEIRTTQPIQPSKWSAVRKAIEFVLNDSHAKYIREAENKYGVKIITEKELLDAEEKAFEAGRGNIVDVYIGGGNTCKFNKSKYPTFSDYKNSTK